MAALGLHCYVADFLKLQRVGATLCCFSWASHCSSFSCCGAQALECSGFSSCSSWAQQLQLTVSGVQAQQLWRMGPVTPQHVRSSWIKLCPPQWQVDSFLSTTLPGKSYPFLFAMIFPFMSFHFIFWLSILHMVIF